MTDRTEVYLRQSGRSALTARQRRRVRKSEARARRRVREIAAALGYDQSGPVAWQERIFADMLAGRRG